MLSELDLGQLEAGPAASSQDLLLDHVRENRAGFLSGRRLDVDALEEIAVCGEGVDLALSGRPRNGERGHNIGRSVVEAHDLAHLAVSGELLRGEIEHRGSVAVHAGVDVHGQVAALGLGLHGRDPVRGFLLIQLHAQTLGGLDDPRDGGLALLVRIEGLVNRGRRVQPRARLARLHGSFSSCVPRN